jgi:hypothetical protein
MGIGISKTLHGYSLHPLLSYVDTCNFETRELIGSIDIGAFEFEFPVATIENEFPVISIFPNPANDFFTIQINRIDNADGNVLIVNSAAEIIFDQRIHEGENIINTSTWSRGIYFIVVTSNNQKQIRKIVVK